MTSALLLLALGGEAQAAPYMWGIGPSVSTLLFPIRYPGQFPTALADTAFDHSGVRADVQLAGHGVLYIDQDSRLGAHGGFGFGSGWTTRWFDLNYERIFLSDSGFHMLGGLGLGMGGNTFTDDQADRLEITFFLGRVQVGGIYRDKTRAYELDIFAQYQLGAEHRYTPAAETEPEVIKGRGSRYGSVGAEVTVFFGDFTPPKKGGGKKGGKQGGKGKGR
ncbi:MAG: hypothetical protein H6739_24135 [Alphaproteobacteria bacterium]|nr:hypothetical protein [Alphaproteobacteria bacterium]